MLTPRAFEQHSPLGSRGWQTALSRTASLRRVLGGPARCQRWTVSLVASDCSEGIPQGSWSLVAGSIPSSGSWLQSGSNFLDQTFQGSRAFGEKVEDDG